MRHPDEIQLQKMHNFLLKIVDQVGQQTNIGNELNQIWYAPPVVFHPTCISAVESAVSQLEISAMKITSGAGHDAVYLSRIVPTSMIFIPCKAGLSHNEQEHAEPANLIAGANVLLHTVLSQAQIL